MAANRTGTVQRHDPHPPCAGGEEDWRASTTAPQSPPLLRVIRPRPDAGPWRRLGGPKGGFADLAGLARHLLHPPGKLAGVGAEKKTFHFCPRTVYWAAAFTSCFAGDGLGSSSTNLRKSSRSPQGIEVSVFAEVCDVSRAIEETSGQRPLEAIQGRVVAGP